MAKYPPLLIILFLIILVVLFSLFVSFGKITYFNSHKEKFIFSRNFPFEMYHQKHLKQVSFFRLILIILLGFNIAINVLYALSFRYSINNLSFALILSFFFIFANIFATVLFILTPNYLTQFKLYTTIYFGLAIMSNTILGIISLTSLFSHFSYKIIGGIALFLSLFNIIVLFNPKLKNWSKLESNKNVDGTISFVRPKKVHLAYYTWLSFLTLIIGELLLLVSLLLMSLGI